MFGNLRKLCDPANLGGYIEQPGILLRDFPIRIHPILGEELREVCARYRDIVVVEANDGQYADLVELAIHREVKRVPVLGGRISLEAVREGIDRVLSGGPSEPPIPAEPTEKQRPSPLGVAGA